ncbi:collagen alpha-2(I) chain-like [Mus musculus]|uniref:collagen alpha-2(I) chain-like n=1 Tax=Mus musculus TaxID=10090 RepID=UPI0016760F69|nr:collagen alpha-2(I) chain-like [Mus musculus]
MAPDLMLNTCSMGPTAVAHLGQPLMQLYLYLASSRTVTGHLPSFTALQLPQTPQRPACVLAVSAASQKGNRQAPAWCPRMSPPVPTSPPPKLRKGTKLVFNLGLQEGARHLVANDRSTSTRDGVAAGPWSIGHAPRALVGMAKELRWTRGSASAAGCSWSVTERGVHTPPFRQGWEAHGPGAGRGAADTGLAKQPLWGPAPSSRGSRASTGSSGAPGAWARRGGIASGENAEAGEELGAVTAALLAAEMAVAAAPAASAAQRDRTPPAAAGARGSPGNRGRGRGRGPRRLGSRLEDPGWEPFCSASQQVARRLSSVPSLKGSESWVCPKEGRMAQRWEPSAERGERGDAGVESEWRGPGSLKRSLQMARSCHSRPLGAESVKPQRDRPDLILTSAPPAPIILVPVPSNHSSRAPPANPADFSRT